MAEYSHIYVGRVLPPRGRWPGGPDEEYGRQTNESIIPQTVSARHSSPTASRSPLPPGEGVWQRSCHPEHRALAADQQYSPLLGNFRRTLAFHRPALSVRCFLFVLTAPTQTGQPLTLARVRENTAACHTCPSVQHHQTFLLLPRVTSDGSSSPFNDRCHSFASFGLKVCRSLNPGKTFLPVQ